MAKKQKMEGQSSLSSLSWCSLDEDIIYSIMNRLHYVDQLRFRAVCKNWREANLEGVKYADKLPWMMALDPGSGSCHLYDPFYRRKHTIKTTITSKGIFIGASILASKHGWVLLGKIDQETGHSGLLFFYDPFCDKIIHLPKLHHPYYLRATFTKSPVCSDCEIFLLDVDHRKNKIQINTCRVGDPKWSGFFFDRGDFAQSFQVEYMDGILYATSSNRTSVGAFNVALQEWKTFPCPPDDENHCKITESLIKCEDGNLLLAQFGVNRLPHRDWTIFRLDRSRMKWIQVKRIDNGSLFMGYTPLFVPLEKASGLTDTIHWHECYRPGRYSTRCPKILEIYSWDLIEVNGGIREEYPKLWLLPPQP